jgi:tRNA-intron endonuclease
MKNTVSSNAKEAFELYNKSLIGDQKGDKIYFSLIEAFYLLERKRIAIYEGKKKLDREKFLNKLKKAEPDFWTRYSVFADMRNRGYILKTALKFGADFRVYEKGKKPGQAHAKWLVFPVHESSKLTWREFAAKVRVANSTKKRLLIGILDDENDVTYYEINWQKP